MSLSPLGFGVMRVTQNPNGSFPPETNSLLSSAYEKGINFFDSGYGYLGGHSETLIRDAIVQKYPRDTFYISDKLPVWNCNNRSDMDRIFDTQLERLGVEYIDFYLLHFLHRKRWFDIYEKGVLDFLEEKKREGRIRKIGFSMHDTVETLEIIENAYDWEFVLLQINYLDWIAQRAKESYDYLDERNIPCMVMEPVGGGRLAKLPKEAENIFKELKPESSIPSWAFRFVSALPNVAVTLSGMNTIEQLEENIETFSDVPQLSKEENEAFDRVAEIFRLKNGIPCTFCNYCVDDCPKEVDIPNIFQRFNEYTLFDNPDFSALYFLFIPDGRRADSCVFCGKCNKNCPQNIDIPAELKRVWPIISAL
jgi:hypothetical protein